jgi:hypothetical protein
VHTLCSWHVHRNAQEPFKTSTVMSGTSGAAELLPPLSACVWVLKHSRFAVNLLLLMSCQMLMNCHQRHG